MIVRFFVDPDTGLAQIERHNVTPVEVLEVLRGPSLHGPGRDGTRVVEGQSLAERHLQVVCRENESDGSILVITAYDLVGKARAVFRRRRRRHA